MSVINRLWRAPVFDVNVNSPQKADELRHATIRHNLKKDGEVKSSAKDVTGNETTGQYEKTVDRVIGDGDEYVTIALFDLAIGPGFCHCDCQCTA